MDPSSLLAQTQSAQIIDTIARTPLSKILIVTIGLTALRFLLKPLLNVEPHKRGGTYRAIRFLNETADSVIFAAIFIFFVIRPFVLQTFVIPSGSMWPTLKVHDYIIANKAVYRYSAPQRGDIVVFRPPVDAIVDKSQIDASGRVNIDYIKRCIGVPGDTIELKKGILYRNGERVKEEYVHLSTCTDNVMSGGCVNFRDLSVDERKVFPEANFKLVKNKKGELMPLNWTDRDANSSAPEPIYFNQPGMSYAVAPRFSLPPEFASVENPVARELIDQPAQKLPVDTYLMFGDNRNNSFDSRGWGIIHRDDIVGRSEVVWMPIRNAGRTR